MAGRVIELAQRGRRTRAETSQVVVDLQNHVPIALSLDQEFARTSEVDLLTANHPLVIAAADVPGHRQARFASVKVSSTEGVPAGKYLVVLAHAEHASRGGDEIWGASVDFNGVSKGEAPADAVLAALAGGTLREGGPVEADALPRLALRAQRELDRRHRAVQDLRDVEEGALTEARRAILSDQHERRMSGIRRRMTTMLARDRGQHVLRMVEGQQRRQQERYEQLIAELETKKPKAVALRSLAVCLLEVTR